MQFPPAVLPRQIRDSRGITFALDSVPKQGLREDQRDLLNVSRSIRHGRRDVEEDLEADPEFGDEVDGVDGVDGVIHGHEGDLVDSTFQSSGGKGCESAVLHCELLSGGA